MDILRSVIVWIVGVAIIIAFFPVIMLTWLVTFPFDKKRIATHQALLAQACILSYAIPVWRVKVEGRQKAIKGVTYVIICNHQSILDILLVNCLRYNYKWVSKMEVLKVPFLGWYVRMANYLTVDRSDKESKEKLLEEAYHTLKEGTSIMIFPEGTRSFDGQIGFFKRGAFQLALDAGVPILPVLIDGTGSVLPKHGIIFGGFHRIRLKVFDPVLPENFVSRKPEDLAAWFQSDMTWKLEQLRNN